MRSLLLAVVLWLLPIAAVPCAAQGHDAAVVAREAVDEALTLPPDYKRDVVLRSVSRNLRWFGQVDEGVRAARAMSDGGVTEVPPNTRPGPPRFVPLKEAMPTGNPCDAGPWREGGGLAATPKAREKWASACLLRRDFDWIGLPEVAEVRTVAAGLPDGETKAAVLAMLIRFYRDAETLRFASEAVARARLPAETKAGLEAMLAEPVALYRLGRKSEALAAAKAASTFASKAQLIELLVRNDDESGAIEVFETMAATPPEDAEYCYGWFGPIGGLSLEYVGNAYEPSPGLRGFLDRLPASPLFRKVCPAGLDAEVAVAMFLAAGRDGAAIARARAEPSKPFLLVDCLLQVGRAELHRGGRDAARGRAMEAAGALPLFDPGDPVRPQANDRVLVVTTGPDATPRNYGELEGNTGRRFEVIRLLAASGAIVEADALARAQLAGALRAVALSAAVAGRAGYRFDDQAPSLETIGKSDL
ncbi:hypothetical protein [Sphingomonas sp.]|uniref:hypothetical protein n=1 Tax=Sphingomonas sp. TaxID=28214 RepID=UPI0035BBAFA5